MTPKGENAQGPTKAHATLSPSSAERWVECPGSVALSQQFPRQETSVHAAEGTAAHSLCERRLKKEIPSHAELVKEIGEIIEVEGGKFEIEVTEEMTDAVILYHDTVMAEVERIRNNGKPAPIHFAVEQRVFAKQSIDPKVYGTSDVYFYQKGNELVVADFKYGKGVAVEAQGNKQMAVYAIAVMDTINSWAFDRVRIVVIQPRAPHADGPVRIWDTTPAELKEMAKELKAAVAETRLPNARLTPGSHCRWCPAISGCPAKVAKAQEVAAIEFAAEPAIPAVSAMTVEQMADVMKWEDSFLSMFDAIRVRLKEVLESGGEVPGFKLVEGKSNRKWIDEDAVVREFAPILGEDALYEKKLLSPSKLEKIIGKKGDKLSHLTFKPAANKTLARSSDARPATITSAQEDFGNGLLDQLGAVTEEQDNKDPLDGLM